MTLFLVDDESNCFCPSEVETSGLFKADIILLITCGIRVNMLYKRSVAENVNHDRAYVKLDRCYRP